MSQFVNKSFNICDTRSVKFVNKEGLYDDHGISEK